ncbi:hypothetical protein TNCV_3952381 [Trichonephila clavipes]|uniref:Uncharacterized protein n=1 Tax=Trichonephila clavipes TaxID=2585209 RepID=A0A8X6S302_TRICX|nr:hypothetical protein TNCV_3952361 [Trichonephila clavipes]GFY04831.1 hypothetical protein TNCV_3952381 [Trichonephila clavipes]
MSSVYVQQVGYGDTDLAIGDWVCVTVGVSGSTESLNSPIFYFAYGYAYEFKDSSYEAHKQKFKLENDESDLFWERGLRVYKRTAKYSCRTGRNDRRSYVLTLQTSTPRPTTRLFLVQKGLKLRLDIASSM